MLMFIAVILMLLLLAIGSHVAVAMGLVTTGLILMIDGVPMTVISQTAFKAVNSYPLMAVPMFILAGNLMMSGISKLPVHEVVRGVMPFYGVRLTGLMLITYIPSIPSISLVLL